MAPSTAKPRQKKATAGKSSPSKTTDRDNGLERVYARLEPADKKLLDELAADDERSTMKYLERLIRRHLETERKKRLTK